MIVQLNTITDDGDDVVWIDAYIDENKISVGWKIPAYIDDELDLIVFTDELNLFVDGNQISVKSTSRLLAILEERLTYL